MSSDEKLQHFTEEVSIEIVVRMHIALACLNVFLERPFNRSPKSVGKVKG